LIDLKLYPSWFRLDPLVRSIVVPSLAEEFIPPADVIVATAWHTAESVARYDKSRGRKFYYVQEFETLRGPEQRVLATYRLPLRKIVINQWTKQMIEEMGEHVAGIVPHGLDATIYRVLIPPQQRKECAGMMYSPSRIKGTQEGFAALEGAKRRFPWLKAIVYGAFRRPRNLPQWIDYFRDPTDEELVRLYNQISIFVCPSWVEGWGLPAFESMACGCALVTTDNGGVREFSRPGESALYSPPKDPAGLTRNLIRLLQDPELRIRLAYAGLDSVRRFSWDKAVTRFEEILRV
jgi:glycosyltransferase involved in cell wall biosynthesis